MDLFDEYHQPDNTWTIWVKSYEEYAKRWIIKGRFHKEVPEDVVKSYKVAEYIMAHAWYHYPMYDEALIRIAGIFEMAIKLRTEQLNLPLRAPDKQGKLREIHLYKLITALCEKEEGKELGDYLNHLRRIRNIVAHPDRYGFSGGNIWHVVQNCVNVLNRIFLHEERWISCVQEKQRVTHIASSCFGNCGILEINSQRYLVENSQITLALPFQNEWRYLLITHPVYADLPRALVDHKFLPVFCIEIADVFIQDSIFSARILENDQLLRIEPTSHPSNIATYEKYLNDKKNASVFDQHLLITATDHQQPLEESAMCYKYVGEMA
jgi:hypothetical protein